MGLPLNLVLVENKSFPDSNQVFLSKYQPEPSKQRTTNMYLICCRFAKNLTCLSNRYQNTALQNCIPPYQHFFLLKWKKNRHALERRSSKINLHSLSAIGMERLISLNYD